MPGLADLPLFLSSAQYFSFSFKNVVSVLIINLSGMFFQSYI